MICVHSHVASGTAEYLADAVPFIWSSPVWFPLLVAVATVSLAELRLRLRAPRTSVTARQGLAGVAAVIGIYIITALEHTAPTVPVTVPAPSAVSSPRSAGRSSKPC